MKIEQGNYENPKTFIENVAPTLGRLFGIPHLRIEVGDGWATRLAPGDNLVTVDPSRFINQGFSPESTDYSMLHEIAAHLKPKINEPHMTQVRLDFFKLGAPQALFLNILEDVAGNNLVHAVFPRMEKVAEEHYAETLFPGNDYSNYPLHVQFLYKIIKQEMVPGSNPIVSDEVDKTLNYLRDYNGIDIIKYSTSVAKTSKEELSFEERFEIWLDIIYPEFEKFLEEDEDNFSPEDTGKCTCDYENSHTNYTLDDTETIVTDQKKAGSLGPLDSESEYEKGDIYQYNEEISKFQDIIKKLRDTFLKIVKPKKISKKKNRRKNEGIILDPDSSSANYINSKNDDQPLMIDIDKKDVERKLPKDSDYVIIIDTSASMSIDGGLKKAASTLVLFLESLHSIQRYSSKMGGPKIRTQVITYASSPNCTKPISENITNEERLDSYFSVLNSDGGGSEDYFALEMLLNQSDNYIDNKTIFMVTDGESSNMSRSRKAIEKLRETGWKVYGVIINSQAAEIVFGHDFVAIKSPDELAEAMAKLLNESINRNYRPS